MSPTLVHSTYELDYRAYEQQPSSSLEDHTDYKHLPFLQYENIDYMSSTNSQRPRTTLELLHTYVLDFFNSCIYRFGLTGIGYALSHGAFQQRLSAVEHEHKVDYEMTADWKMQMEDLEQGVTDHKSSFSANLDNIRRDVQDIQQDIQQDIRGLRRDIVSDIRSEFRKLKGSLRESLGGNHES